MGGEFRKLCGRYSLQFSFGSTFYPWVGHRIVCELNNSHGIVFAPSRIKVSRFRFGLEVTLQTCKGCGGYWSDS